MEFEPGDKVIVKEGVGDPDFGTIIEGWTGEITEVESDTESPINYRIEWDYLTIKEMSEQHIDICDKENLDHTCMYLSGDDIELQPVNVDTEKPNFLELVYQWIIRGR